MSQSLWAAVVSVGPYKDIDFRHWAAKPAYIVYKANIMPGLKKDKFGGKFKLTRFQFAEVLNALIGRREVSNTMVIVFNDINSKNKYYEAVSKVTRAGIIRVESGSFKGRNPISRYEFAKGMDKVLKMLDAEPPIPRDNSIVVTDVGNDSTTAVNEVINNWQLTEGYSDKTFRGFNDITRYEALEMIAKAALLVSEPARIAMKEKLPEPELKSLVNASSPDVLGTPMKKSNKLAELEKALNGESNTSAPLPKPSSKPEAVKPKLPVVKATPAPVKPKSTSSDSIKDLAAKLNALGPTPKPVVVKPEPTPTPKPAVVKPKPTPTPKPAVVKPKPAPVKPKSTSSVSIKDLAARLNALGPASKTKPVLPSVKPTPKPVAKTPSISAIKPKINQKSLESLASKLSALGTPPPMPKSMMTLEKFALKLHALPPRLKSSPPPGYRLTTGSLEKIANKLNRLPGNNKPEQKTTGPSLESLSARLSSLGKKNLKPGPASQRPLPVYTSWPEAPTYQSSRSPTPTTTRATPVPVKPQTKVDPVIPQSSTGLKPELPQLNSMASMKAIEDALQGLNKAVIKPISPRKVKQSVEPDSQPSSKPTKIVTKKIKPTPTKVDLSKRPLIANRVILSTAYNPLYSEQVPSDFIGQQNIPQQQDQTFSGDSGLNIYLDSVYWLDSLISDFVPLGVSLKLSTLGGYSHTDQQLQQSADISEVINTNLGILYKVMANERMAFVAGLDNYFRLSSSSNDLRSSYFLAAKSYIGIGAKTQFVYRFFDWWDTEISISPHYVIQDLTNIQLSTLPLNRVDVQINLSSDFKIFRLWERWLSLNIGYSANLLFSLSGDSSQNQHGINLGVGYYF